ncbi:MAG: hypothetical protein ACAH89_04900 [Rariglobus sp.]|nr:hypothetical protein [Rariglobus sp.]
MKISVLPFVLVSLLGLTPLHAEMLTLTDKQGRSIKADVISCENETAKIKRDDGQTFDLPLSNLAEADQRKLREWAKANPPKLGPDAIVLEFSRGKFSTEKESQSDGAVTAYKDQWGYSLILTNRSKNELTDIRAEYILFVKQDNSSNYRDKGAGFRRVKHTTKVDSIPLHGKITFRTETVPSYRYVLAQGWVWGSGGNQPIKDTLHGIWLRIYVGNELVLEKISPEDLSKTEKWKD